MSTVIFIALPTIFLAGLEWTARIKKIDRELIRKGAHLSNGVVALFAPYFLSRVSVILLGLLFALTLLYVHIYKYSAVMRSTERHRYGVVLFPIGIALVAFAFLPAHMAAYQFGVIVLTLADPIAYVIGTKYGHFRFSLGNIKKTAEGSLAFFLITLLVSILFIPYAHDTAIITAISISLLVTLIEMVAPYGTDNIFIPLSAALLFTLTI